MAGEYVCENCSLKILYDTDHLEDQDGNIVWLSYLHCANCGTTYKMLSSSEECHSLSGHPGPYCIDQGNDKLMGLSDAEWIHMIESKEEIALDSIKCLHCGKEGHVTSAVEGNTCPKCKAKKLRSRHFYMT